MKYPTIANIGDYGRKKRFVFGVIMLGLGIIIIAVLLYIDAPVWSRIAVFLPFWMAGSGILQSSGHT